MSRANQNGLTPDDPVYIVRARDILLPHDFLYWGRQQTFLVREDAVSQLSVINSSKSLPDGRQFGNAKVTYHVEEWSAGEVASYIHEGRNLNLGRLEPLFDEQHVRVCVGDKGASEARYSTATVDGVEDINAWLVSQIKPADYLDDPDGMVAVAVDRWDDANTSVTLIRGQRECHHVYVAFVKNK